MDLPSAAQGSDHNCSWPSFRLGYATSLRASSPRRFEGGVGKKRRACNYVSGIWIPSPIPPWLTVDWAVRFSPISAKRKRARMQTRAKGNDVITNVISANQRFASTFSIQVFKFQRRSCKLSFLFRPHRQSAPESLLAGYYTTEMSYPWRPGRTPYKLKGRILVKPYEHLYFIILKASSYLMPWKRYIFCSRSSHTKALKTDGLSSLCQPMFPYTRNFAAICLSPPSCISNYIPLGVAQLLHAAVWRHWTPRTLDQVSMPMHILLTYLFSKWHFAKRIMLVFHG